MLYAIVTSDNDFFRECVWGKSSRSY